MAARAALPDAEVLTATASRLPSNNARTKLQRVVPGGSVLDWPLCHTGCMSLNGSAAQLASPFS
jgi:hypothetical protein